MYFLQDHPWHHETLLYMSDFYKMQGKFPESTSLLKWAIFSFEQSFSFDFKIIGDIPSTRLNFENPDNNLAMTFSECLLWYSDVLGRWGCTWTALEYSKLLLSVDPEED